MSKICLKKAFDRGLRKVAWWWIPLCAISGTILLNQNWLPKFMMTHFEEWQTFEPYRVELSKLEKAFGSDPSNFTAFSDFLEHVERISSDPVMVEAGFRFILKISIFSTTLAILGCFFYVIMIMVAKASVTEPENRQLQRDSKKTFAAGASYMLLGFIKGLCFVVFIPGVYFYIRLMFTGIIITEKSANPLEAIEESWRLTEGETEKMVLLFLFELGLNFFAFITIIGVIPVPPMRYTIRTSVYRQLKGLDSA